MEGAYLFLLIIILLGYLFTKKLQYVYRFHSSLEESSNNKTRLK